jgi:hypothetical protein
MKKTCESCGHYVFDFCLHVRGTGRPWRTRTRLRVRRQLVQLERRLIVAVQRKDMDTLNEIWAPNISARPHRPDRE